MASASRKRKRWLAMLSMGIVLQLPIFGLHPLKGQEVLLPLQTGPVLRGDFKESSQPIALPFFDDFANAYPAPSGALWMAKGGATTEAGSRLLPPTVGVATLDALDANGNLYEDATLGRFAADTLCSRSIALGMLSVADSVVLSFYYLPGGGKGDLWQRIGDAPELEDSLMLDFFRAADSTWVTVWARGGTDVDSLRVQTGREWQYVSLTLVDTGFFNDSFAFRFRNYCSETSSTKPGMAGNCDFWHLDYIVLDRGRTSTLQPESRDVAFVGAAPSMLSVYQAMPARQYRRSDMADSLSMVITNLFGSPLATHYQYAILSDAGDTLFRHEGGYENAPPFWPEGKYQEALPHARPAVDYAFAETDRPAEYTVVHTVREGVGGDDYRQNDTVCFRQVFSNYYAYDDGTSENGYGLTSTASRVYLAYRFDLNVEDTLTAVDIYFNRTLEGENEAVPFNITIWSDNGGKPGAVLYRDATSRHPAFDGLNRFSRYVLDNPVVVSGNVYVGFEQGNNYFINLGFDRSSDLSDRIFYLTGTDWQRSILSGALMIRPCFGMDATVGIVDVKENNEEWKLFPNPASDWVWIEGAAEDTKWEIYDMTGKQLTAGRGNGFPVVGMRDGVYLVRCLTEGTGLSIKKLIIKH